MPPMVTDGTASKCDCAAAVATCSALAATINVVTTAAFIRLTSPRLKCNNCSHLCRSIAFAFVVIAFPLSAGAVVNRRDFAARACRERARREERFHFMVVKETGPRNAVMAVPVDRDRGVQ